jgi:hypothetical protein
MARPNKKEAIVIQKRNKELLAMVKNGYPMDYICSYFGLTKGRISQIIKKHGEQTTEKQS